MTNGEKLQEIFPDMESIIIRDLIGSFVNTTLDGCSTFNLDWWEAEYKYPQTFKWCTDCKEYDQEKHCCHRWSKAIRDTVEEMKEEYIEREVLDELRAEITTLQNRCYALTKGTMCIFCKYECKYKAEMEVEDE